MQINNEIQTYQIESKDKDYYQQETTPLCLKTYVTIQKQGIYAIKTVHRGQSEDSQRQYNLAKELLKNEMSITSTIKNGMTIEEIQFIPIIFPLQINEESHGQCIQMQSPLANKGDAYSDNDQLIHNLNAIEMPAQQIFSSNQNEYIIVRRFVIFKAMKFAFQIATSLNYFHSKNIAHNNIQPKSILVLKGVHPQVQSSQYWNSQAQISFDDDDCQFYLGGFAYAKQIGFTSRAQKNKFFSQKRSTFLSPEISDKNEYFEDIEKKGDVYALGVSIFAMLFQTYPEHRYCIVNQPQLFWLQVEKQLNIYKNMTDTDDLKDLITKILHPIHEKRITISQVLYHRWLFNIAYYCFHNFN